MLEKNKQKYETLEFRKTFDVGLTKSENNQILLFKISHRFLVTTKQGDQMFLLKNRPKTMKNHPKSHKTYFC